MMLFGFFCLIFILFYILTKSAKSSKSEAIRNTDLSKIKSIEILDFKYSKEEENINTFYLEKLTTELDKKCIFLKPELKNEAINYIFENHISLTGKSMSLKSEEVSKYFIMDKKSYEKFEKAKKWSIEGGRKSPSINEVLNDYELFNKDTTVLDYYSHSLSSLLASSIIDEIIIDVADKYMDAIDKIG